MAEFTLLEMTQNILSRMSSDEVNSISDTTESMQVANIIQNKFFDMVARGQFPDFQMFIQLDPSVDPDKPTLMYVPDSVSKICWIKYFDSNPSDGQSPSTTQVHDLNLDLQQNASAGTPVPPGYLWVKILTIEDFLNIVNNFNTTDSDVFTYNFTEGGHNFRVNYRNSHQPRQCCVVSDRYVLFDTYDATQDTTLQASKTMCLAEKVPDFELRDDFIPPLDDQEFPLLMNEAAALAFLELKQMPHPKAEQEIKRGWSYIQKKKATVNKPSYFQQLPNFGRVPRTGGYTSGVEPYTWMDRGA